MEVIYENGTVITVVGEGIGHVICHVNDTEEFTRDEVGKYIERAVNNHDELLRAIETAIEIISDSYGEDHENLWVDSDCQAVNVLKSTLAKAKRE